MNAGPIRNELAAHGLGDGSPTVGGHWNTQEHTAVAREEISLPGQPDYGVTSPHQEAIAGILSRPGNIVEHGPAKHLQSPFVSSIYKLEEQAPVASRQSHWFEEVQL